jgi:single-strand DNA-binding protein
MWGSANFTRMAGAGNPAAPGQPAAATAGHDNSPDEPQAPEDEDDQASDPPAVFVDEASGEVQEVDEETGELKGAAA